MRADSKRALAKGSTRQKVLDAATYLFRRHSYEAVTVRTIASAVGMSTGAIFAHYADKEALYLAAFGFPHPWRPIVDGPKDGTPCLLLVDYSEETNAKAVAAAAEQSLHWNFTALEDALLARTIGHNNDDNVGPEEGQGWEFAGWCWSHDHYTGGQGTAVAFVTLDAVAALPPEPVVR